MNDQEKTYTYSATERKERVSGALMDIRAFSGKQAGSWPLMLVDAVLRSESGGDPNRQDELIESIAVLLGLGTEEYLTIPEAANRLAGERTRGFIIGTLHGAQANAEAKVAELKAEREADPDPDGRLDLMAQSCHHQGVVEALGYAIEVVNISELPGDNDQQIGELITPEEAKMIEDLISGEAGPETEEHRAMRRRLWKLAEAAK